MAFWRYLLDHVLTTTSRQAQSPSSSKPWTRGGRKFCSTLKIAVPGWRDTESHSAKGRSETKAQPVIRCFKKGFASRGHPILMKQLAMPAPEPRPSLVTWTREAYSRIRFAC